MRHRLFVHLVWTTRGRESLIDAALAEFLTRFLPAVALQERARLIASGIVADHVHLLLRLHPSTTIPRLVQRLKGGSAAVASRERHGRLLWAKGYNIHSVSLRAVPAVVQYVLSQAEHHPGLAIPGYRPDCPRGSALESRG